MNFLGTLLPSQEFVKDMVKKEDEEMKEALDVLYEISGNEDIIQLAELRDKAIRDEKSRLSGAKEEGREENSKLVSNIDE